MKDGCPARPDSHREHLKDDRGLDDPFVFQKDPVQQALVHAQAVFRLQQQQRCRAGKDVAGDLDGLHGAGAQQDAGLLGLPAILLRTGRETYAQSLEEAIRTVTLVQQERIRTETYKIITESVKDGLLYVDASGIIRLDNPAACLMRDAPLKDVPLETAFPCMVDSFSRAMRDCTEIQGEVRKVRGVSHCRLELSPVFS